MTIKFDETPKEVAAMAGKTIAFAQIGTVNGYDTLLLMFKDGKHAIVQEEGQAGYFSVTCPPEA